MADEKTPEQVETERLTQLVLNICDGTVFTSIGLSSEEIPLCFMVLALAGKDDIPKDAIMVWEELSKAGPRSINGLPCFFSCHFENKETTDRVMKAVRAEIERRKSVTV